jgi:hypothetical protein
MLGHGLWCVSVGVALLLTISIRERNRPDIARLLATGSLGERPSQGVRLEDRIGMAGPSV